MTQPHEPPFFIGFRGIPRGLRLFMMVTALVLVAAFAGLGWAIGTAQDDPGGGAFRFHYGPQTVTGVLEARPYPLLRVTAGSKRIPAGHTLMLAGIGKNGVVARVEGLDGGLATATGILIARGGLDMLQVEGGENGLAAAEGSPPPVETRQLGRWRLAGEICDGKCLAGAMRPGRGIGHKACANLCLIGEIPPVFVSTQPVDGSEYLLVAGPDGGPMPAALLNHVAALVELEGEVERRGDLLVLRIDPATVRVL